MSQDRERSLETIRVLVTDAIVSFRAGINAEADARKDLAALEYQAALDRINGAHAIVSRAVREIVQPIATRQERRCG
jgi:hypothetical protein